MDGAVKNIFGLLLFLTLVSIFITSSANAANFTATLTPTPVNGSLSDQLFNLTINNTDTLHNITQINISLPATFVFNSSTNSTTAIDTIFPNTSTILIWSNTTAPGFIDMNGTVQFFYFS